MIEEEEEEEVEKEEEKRKKIQLFCRLCFVNQSWPCVFFVMIFFFLEKE